MSMAFESAELAAALLARFSHGDRTWAQAQQDIARSCDRRFTSRLRWAALVQRGLLHTPVRAVMLFLAARSGWFWGGLFGSTR